MKFIDIRKYIGLLVLLVPVACGGNPDPGLAGQPGDPCAGAWARLYEDAGFSGQRLTITYPTELASFRQVGTDSGAGNLNDRVSSVQWSIPTGCRLVLYQDENFRGTRFQLIGSGREEQNSNLGAFNDQASSARWERG